MAEGKLRTMTVEEFYVWQLDQDERYELVEGIPVPLRGMTGASNVHDAILVNCIIEFGTRLRGKRCRVASADTALRTSIRNTRRPDVTIDCAPLEKTSYEACKPVVVIEVLSPSTRRFDEITKLDEYRRHPSLRHILLIDPDSIRARHYSRPEGGEWIDEALTGAEARVDLGAVEVTLALGALYDRVEMG